jgi:hypothetical protein
MALSDIIAARQAALAPTPREQRLAETQAELQSLIGWAYDRIHGSTEAVQPHAKMDGDILVFTPDADLATELRGWLMAEGVKCALAWESDTRGVLNISVLLAPEPEPPPEPVVVVEPPAEPTPEPTPEPPPAPAEVTP